MQQTKIILAILAILAILLLLASLAPLLLRQKRIGPPVAKTGRTIAADLSISVAELKARLRRHEDLVLVDVRPAREFAAVHLPNSINIPTPLLKGKGYLKTQQVVLINEGYARQELEQECQRLRPLGFTRLSILSGGLLAWQRGGGEILGDPFEANRLAMVPPRLLFLERPYDHRLVIDIDPLPANDEPPLLPEAVPLPDDGGPGFIAKLKRLLTGQEQGVLHSVLLCNGRGQGYDALDRRLKGAGLGPIFYLEGGREGVKDFLKGQALLKQPQRVTTGAKACPTCP